jgi:hypothetical protein
MNGPHDIDDQAPDGDARRESETPTERQPSTIRREVTIDELAPNHVEPVI